MLPVVAIVGRPNVGKSTLFNRLTHTRAALISAYPGTTRDRQYGEVHLYGRDFIVIDTGGRVEDEDSMGKLINQQAEQAIMDADKIVFVVDAKAGITPADVNLAKQLRRYHKTVLLVINKIDNADQAQAIADGFELGLKKPIPISAVHGSGIEELIEELLPITTTVEEDQKKTGIKIAIVGRPNVGKSTLTNRMLGEERVIVHDSPGTTRDSIYVPLEREGKHYTLIDTAGVRRRSKIDELPEKFSVVKTLQAIQEANVVLFLIDAREGVSDQDAKLLGFVLESGRALVIALNKWDGMTEEARAQAKNSLDRHLAFVAFARVHFISARHGSGVGDLFDSIDEAYASATKKLSTPTLTRLLERAVTQHAPPLIGGRRIKLRYAHPGGANPPRIIIHGNQLDSLPDSYRRYLANYFQTKLKLHGTPVYIEVKVSKNPFDVKKKKKKR